MTTKWLCCAVCYDDKEEFSLENFFPPPLSLILLIIFDLSKKFLFACISIEQVDVVASTTDDVADDKIKGTKFASLY